MLLQTSYFILLARLLGVKQYGIFAGAVALTAIVTPYSALGSGLLFVRYVSTDAKRFAAYWANILFATFGVGSLLVGFLYLAAPHLLNPASASLILLVGPGDCICRQLVVCVGQIFQAFEELRMTAAIALLTNSLRLCTVVLLTLFIHHATARQWALSSLVISILAGIVSSIIVTMRFGFPRFMPWLFLSRLGEGFSFSFAGSTQSVYNDIDKSMLSHYGMNVANGVYTMAYRIVDVATIPVNALDAAALPRFFQQSTTNPTSVVLLSLRLARAAVLVGVTMSGCLFLTAPLIPLFVGREFTASVLALRWLCVIPALRGVHQLLGGAITGLGFQRYRMVGQATAAGLNFAMNLCFIPRYGWIGAAWASVVTDGALGVTNWLLLQILSRRRSVPLADGSGTL